MDNNFLVDNPNRPKAKKPPRKPILTEKGKDQLLTIGQWGSGVIMGVSGAIVSHGMGTFFFFLAGGAVAGAICAVLDNKRNGSSYDQDLLTYFAKSMFIGFVNIVAGFVCGIASAVIVSVVFPAAVAHAVTNASVNASADAAENITTLVNRTANATSVLANTTTLSNVTPPCSCTYVPSLYTNNTTFFGCSCPMSQDLAARNVTIPAEMFMSSIKATPVLGAVAGPVREVRALVSRKFESLNRSLKL